MADEDQYKRFGALNVVLVDGDPTSAQHTRMLLSNLGIYQLRVAKNYDQMITMLTKSPADLIAFDAGKKSSQELELIQKLRKEKSSLALTPVLSLSSQTTAKDVHQLVDAGVTELVAKPANVKTIFGRIQNMIDSPRSFVSTKDFKGPDRRRKQQPGMENEGRTNTAPTIVSREQFLKGEVTGPVVIMPDFQLKVKVNKIGAGPMRPAVEDEFIFWSLSDIASMEASYIALTEGSHAAPHLERICNACLSIEARSGAYGYDLGCEVARRLGEFCRHKFERGNKEHLIVLEKHLQTLSTVYHGRMRGEGGQHGKDLLEDLGKLVAKYTS